VKQLFPEQPAVGVHVPPPLPAGDEVPDAENMDIFRHVFSELHFGHGREF
jgi:hypothetical protein